MVGAGKRRELLSVGLLIGVAFMFSDWLMACPNE
jgi:hypothetical protein